MVYNDDDLSILDPDADLSPLDDIDSLDVTAETMRPDPEEMLPLLEDEQPAKRMLAARVFCDLQEPRAIPALIRLLNDTCPLVRVSAAYALGRNSHPDAIEPLIRQLEADWNGYVRKGIVWALGNSRSSLSLKPLLHSLKTEIPAVRIWAASALAQMAQLGYEPVVGSIPPIIEAMIHDPLAAVRSNCAWTLGTLCRELPANVVYATAVDALIQVVEEDADVSVQEDAKSALLKLGDPRGIQAIEAMGEW